MKKLNKYKRGVKVMKSKQQIEKRLSWLKDRLKFVRETNSNHKSRKYVLIENLWKGRIEEINGVLRKGKAR